MSQTGADIFDWSDYLGEVPLVMGVLNITPDSFSDGGKFFSKKDASAQMVKLIAQGADIVDIGAESTRPGSLRVPPEEEINRLQKVLPLDSKVFKGASSLLSLDTINAETAKFGVEHGFSIVNQVDAVLNKSAMFDVVRQSGCGYILGHIQGDVSSMVNNSRYSNLLDDIYKSFELTISSCLKSGIAIEQLAIDPSIGFAKTFEQNMEVLQNLDVFKSFGLPICVGVSRKSMIKQILKEENIEPSIENLDQKSFELYEQIKNDIDIVRVHNVAFYP